jgi:IMP dehydrogenase
VLAFQQSIHNNIKPIVSVGVGAYELDRAQELAKAGAEIFLLDVAHAANTLVSDMFNQLVHDIPTGKFIVGNFGTAKEVSSFLNHCEVKRPDAICVGIGGGSMCLTRVVTGVGIPTLASILDCNAICEELGMAMMVNGGLRNSGDIVKALAAGADLIMLGSMFAGTTEASGRVCSSSNFSDVIRFTPCGTIDCHGYHKEYRGSASISSYETQGKIASWRSPEGYSNWVVQKGPAVNILNQINGGIRSACSYLNAFNLSELRAHAIFNEVSSNTVVENKAHGVNH